MSNEYILENEAIGTFIGDFSTNDVDDDTHTYSFVEGYDESYFKVSGNQLQSNYVFDYELQSAFYIEVRSEDPSGEYVVNNFNIFINEVNEVITGIDEIEITDAKVYPNPTSGIANLHIENAFIGDMSILLYDISGKLHLKQEIKKTKVSINNIIDVHELPSGIYNVVITYKENVQRLKFIKQ